MRYLMICILFLITWSAYGQGTSYHSEDRRALGYYEEARQLLKRAQFREAMEPLMDAVHRDPEFIEVWLSLGSANSRLGRDSLAFSYFKRAIQIDPDYKKSKYAYHEMGKFFFSKAVYDSAEAYLEHYLRTSPGDPKKEKISKSLILDCRFAIQAIATPFEYNIEELPSHANTFPLQYFPALSVDDMRLYFTRREGMNNHNDEDIYFCNYDTVTGHWSVPVSISDQINTEFNEGAASVSADGRTLVFTSCDGRRGFGSCDIFTAEKEGNAWSKPINMGKAINTAAWEAQPSLSADGRILLFVSNRKGGFGGKDLWIAKKDKKGKWQSAFNLGKRVNTPGNEISPFLHANSETIYFSSDGHEGLGGLDIYKSEIEQDSLWEVPVNLGYPLNDSHDQVSLFIASSSKKGLYTIEKQTENGFQSKLYSFDLPDSFRVSRESDYLKGKVFDQETQAPLSAKIQIFRLNEEDYYSEVASDKVNGEYTLVLTRGYRYGVYVTSPGYLFVDFTFDFDKIEGFDKNILNIALQPIKAGASSRLSNVFFDHDDYNIKKESMSELRVVYYFLKRNPKVVMEIAGHTDDQGTEAYNLELSTKRAQTVYDFLISRGIRASQLTYKGYGESEPLVTATTYEDQSKNRRIEFKVSKITE